jgi:hypothetical protein
MRVPRTEAAVIKINRKMASLTELKDLSKDFRKDPIDTFTLDDFGFDSYYKNNSFIAMLSFL